MNTRVLHLHIDRIVVDGLPASAQKSFLRALEDGLTRMANEDIPASFKASRRRIGALDAGTMRANSSGQQAAAQVVKAIQNKIASGMTATPSAGEDKRHG